MQGSRSSSKLLREPFRCRCPSQGCTTFTTRPPRPAEARRAISGLRPAFGRLEEIPAGKRKVVLAFVKNPTAYNTTLREVLRRPGLKHVLAAHSNTVVDGDDFAW